MIKYCIVIFLLLSFSLQSQDIHEPMRNMEMIKLWRMVEFLDLNADQFDAIGGSYAFPEFTGTKDDINDLEVGDVVFFKTVNDKHGYIKVINIYQKGYKIDFDMKVEN